jgi:biotin transport system substrate-specific component
MSRSSHLPLEAAVADFRSARFRFFRYRFEADAARKAALALGFAALTGVAAQVRIPLPFTPVPITLQTFAVLLTGVALGARWGGASQTAYVGLGAAGVPWFAGASAGLGTILGPTGGYIVGFVFAAALVGYLVDRHVEARSLPALLGLFLVANFVVIYGFGLPWLYGWLTLVTGSPLTVTELLTMGLFPFVLGDLVKILGAAAVGKALTPTEAYGPERQPVESR